MVEATSEMLKSISGADLLEMKEMDERLSISMNFYSIMTYATRVGKPEMLPFVACRMVQYTMEKGLCKFSIVGLVQFASTLCTTSKNAKKDIADASRIGKAAMSCSRKRYNSSVQLPNLYSVYYGCIAPNNEPLQSCSDMLQQGFDAAMSLGETGLALFNAIQHINTELIAGVRLPTLLEKVDYYLKLANTYQNEASKIFLSANRETISLLIGGTSRLTPHAIHLPTNMVNEKIYMHRAMQAYWQGYSERCQYYIDKFILNVGTPTWRFQLLAFVSGLNSIQLKNISNSKRRSTLMSAIVMLKDAASLSNWNWRNKVRYNQSFFDVLVFMFSHLTCEKSISLLAREISKIFPRSGAILILGPSARSRTVFTPKQQQRSPSVLCRCHRLRSLIWIYS